VVIDPDQIARGINPKNPRAADRRAGVAALILFRECIQAGRSLSIETTLSGQTVLNRLREARAASLEIGLYYVGLDNVETNVGRVALRAAAGGHYIEPEVVRRRAKSSLRNLPAAIALADRTVIFDNSGERHQRILEINHGALRILKEPPDWLMAILPAIEVNLVGYNPGN
jgi:predicted ABC-type ATPase